MVKLTYNKNNQLIIGIIVLVVLIIGVILLIAWRISRDKPPDDGKPPIGDQCTSSSDCTGTSICTNGFCISACQSNLDCPTRWNCLNGNCQPECIINDDCPTQWTCEEGTCTPECIDDSECLPGQTCLAGRCEALVIGCDIVQIPMNIQGSISAPGEITVTWDQSINATGYIAYLGLTVGFEIPDAIDAASILEPSRTVVFSSLAADTYYVRVSAISNICDGTDLSSAFVGVIP